MQKALVTYETKIFVNERIVDKFIGGTYIMNPMDSLDVLLAIITEQVKCLGEDDLVGLRTKLEELGVIK